MKRTGGFTLIELLITITIMVILMTLAVVNIRGTIVKARDEERKSDVESIARGLEQRYNSGNNHVIWIQTKGSYPGNNEFLHAVDGWDWCDGVNASRYEPCHVDGGYATDFLPGTTKETFHSPDSNDVNDFHSTWVYGASSQDTVGRQQKIHDEVALGDYIYEPLDANGDNCYDAGCVRFNLYYETEADDVVHVVKSKHQ